MKPSVVLSRLQSSIAKARRQRGSALVLAVVFVAIFGGIVAYVLLASSRQSRNTFRTRLFNTSLSAAATLMKSMTQQAYFVANTRPTQVGGSFDNLDATILQIKPNSLPGFLAMKSGGKSLNFFKAASADNGTYSVQNDPTSDWNGFNIRSWKYDAVTFVNAGENNVVDPRASRMGFEGAGFRSDVQINYIPLYQYAIFYNDDLEFHPGPNMTVLGPVHSNKTLWAAAGNSLTFKDKVSAAGDFRSYRDFKGVSGATAAAKRVNVKGWDPESADHSGTVNVSKKGTANTYKLNGDLTAGMDTNLNTFLDSKDSNWLENALDRFGGNLTDVAMGNKTILPPLPFIEDGNGLRQQADPAELIQRADVLNDIPDMKRNKMEYMADYRITGDPTSYKLDQNGNPVLDANGNKILDNVIIEPGILDADGLNLTQQYGPPIPNESAPGSGKYLVTGGQFIDYRENKTVNTFDVNMGEMYDRGLDGLKTGNGMLYIAPDPGAAGTISAVRLINAATNLPAKDGANTLSVITNQPMYLEGDVNNGSNRKTLLLAADAMTVTSKHLNMSTARNSASAGSVVTNAIFMLGQVSSKYVEVDANGVPIPNGKTSDYWKPGYGRNHWAGGVHNVMRYLESWGGKKHTYNGSLICLFSSRVATSEHQPKGSAAYYGAPNRDYNWDASLKTKEPPRGMPILVEVKTSPMTRISKEQAIALLNKQ